MHKNVDGDTSDRVEWRQQEDGVGGAEAEDVLVLVDHNECLLGEQKVRLAEVSKYAK